MDSCCKPETGDHTDLECACAGVGDAEEVVKTGLGGGGAGRTGRDSDRRPRTGSGMVIDDGRAQLDGVGRPPTGGRDDEVQR